MQQRIIQTMTQHPDVTAPVRYLAPGQHRPIYIASQGGADAALSIGADFEEHMVTIHNARDLQPAATLDTQGFCLIDHPTSIADFYQLDDNIVAYEAEIMSLVLSATGAADALVFDHTLRSDSRQVRSEHSTREPASVIHNDYTPASAVKRVRDLLPEQEAEQRLQQRFAIINVWRSIRGKVLNSPLALCSYASAQPTDFVASERRAKDRIGELQLVTFNPAHRWFYFPEQKLNESLLIKTFDSATDGRARGVAHTAFDNPLAPAGAPPRESMESRLLVFF
ncbi:hypothetical protein A3709_16995 [Halioglobus sp. HI00S01]|uniref:CmcJ/NvfI family oxidoreductase n=1 Tax=Halioglobus sp. HI00S01 TaxID=1822214 RepID=UPI0007C2726E|nr:CmcJ/NvfI family oxidoreductase [Halioglobus sp. HI00S01]KZX58701.1 hypothetical protein A3709_16995 [Halioglobus sp. HI00S01]